MAKVALCGLGAIGTEILKYLLERRHEVSSVVDSDPQKVGKTVQEVTGLESGVRIQRSLRDASLDGLDAAVFSTQSRLSQLHGDIEFAATSGLDVLSTCEELAYPSRADQVLTAQLDALAQRKGVTIVGVGVNPGFIMDWIPALVSSASKAPTSIHVVRSVDVSRRRRQLQTKTGVGLTKAKFERGVEDGTLGHVGLIESANLIAVSLGEVLGEVRYGISPAMGSDDYVVGVRQYAEGVAGNCKIRLNLEMTITSADFDVIEIKGEPSIKVRFEKGVFGDSATVALTVHALERIQAARPGLITVLELPLVTRPR